MRLVPREGRARAATERSVAVILPAAGAGTRMGGRTPKQFLKLSGTSIVRATTERFARHPAVASIVVVAPPAHVRRTRELLRALPFPGSLAVVEGGRERQESVALGLRAIVGAPDVIVVHDAVRPFVTRSLIDAVLAAACEHGAAICAVPVKETLKRVIGDVVEETVDRTVLWSVQTPQAFRAALLREAHDKARRDGFVGTDEAVLVERLGERVRVVPGLETNVKITTREDLRLARARGELDPDARASASERRSRRRSSRRGNGDESRRPRGRR